VRARRETLTLTLAHQAHLQSGVDGQCELGARRDPSGWAVTCSRNSLCGPAASLSAPRPFITWTAQLLGSFKFFHHAADQNFFIISVDSSTS
jgi:hypothetical protein